MSTITKTIWLMTIFCFTLSGCTINEVVTAEETELVVAEAPPDESMLLDIGVVEFDAGIRNPTTRKRAVFSRRFARPKFVICLITSRRHCGEPVTGVPFV